jgi:ketosteroid isomerase-like protein
MATLAQNKDSIRELIARFADAVTRKDPEAFGTLWSEKGEWIIGEPMSLSVAGLDSIQATFSRIVCKWEFFAQFANSVLIEVKGKHAKARSTCEEYGINSRSKETYHNVALYFDEFILTPEGWRFRKREYRYLWLDDRPLSGKTFAVPKLGP